MTWKKISILAGFLCSLILNPRVTMAEEAEVYTASDFVMNTVVSETIYGADEDPTKEIITILKDIEENYLSWTIETSEIYQINVNCGQEILLSETTAEYLQEFMDLANWSEGAIDPTIGNLIREWEIDGENPHIPAEKVINDLLKNTGLDKIILKDNCLKMEAGCTLDLGAIGKGIGCDEVFKYIQDKEDIQGMILNLGGSSVMSYGKKPDGTPWKVGLTDPRDTQGDYLGVISLNENEFLSTSGDYEKFFMENDVRYHHIFDPATGYPVWNGICSVTVICNSGAMADGLSTACFVKGVEESVEFLKKYQADALFVTEDGKIYVTDGMEERFMLLKDNYQSLPIAK